MSKYKKMPWRGGFRSIPSSVTSAIAALDSDTFMVSAVKTIKTVEIESIYAHLMPKGFSDSPSSILPPASVGIWSERNQNGWEIVRKDLPMIKKTFYWETPNFGDASRFGTHAHIRVRDVYQREYFEGRNFKIEVQVLKRSPVDGSAVCQFSITFTFDKAHVDQIGLLLAINVLQENCGAMGVISSGATREEVAATVMLDWEIFPPGSPAEFIAAFSKGKKRPPVGIVEDRVKLFSLLKPKAFLKGAGGLGSYIGAQYADDLVVFENMEYGNALYILYDDWKEVSKRSRYELIRGTDANFDRFPHTFGWKKAFGKVMSQERKKRGLS